MVDPLSEIVTLLQPAAQFSKMVRASGSWRVRRAEVGLPFYCVVLAGECRLAIDGYEPLILQADDFVLIPAAQGFATSSVIPPAVDIIDPLPVREQEGRYRLGPEGAVPDVEMLVGRCSFASPDAELLVSLLPRLVHVRGGRRLAMLLELVSEEGRAQRPARDVVLTRLLEVMLIEALRSSADLSAAPGLLRGLADERLVLAIRAMHEQPAQAWTVAQLARTAALSRSAFFERFNTAVGVAPMAYLQSWRMALARNLLRGGKMTVAEVAGQVGYGSASAFSVAFTRDVGQPPASYARAQQAAELPLADVL